MSIQRLKSHSKDFTILYKQVLNDKNLSLKAIGLWAYLMGLPDDWSINARDLANRHKDGYESNLSALRELQKNGYAKKTHGDEQKRESGKFAHGGWVIYEEKQTLTVKDCPYTENPTTVKPTTVKPELLSIEELSIEKKEKKQKKTSSAEASSLSSFHFEELKKINENVIKPNLKKWSEEYDKLLKKSGVTPERIKKALLKGIKDEFWRQHCADPKKFIKNFTSIELLNVKEDVFEELKAIKVGLKGTDIHMHLGNDYVEIKHPKYNNPIIFPHGKDLLKKIREEILRLT